MPLFSQVFLTNKHLARRFRESNRVEKFVEGLAFVTIDLRSVCCQVILRLVLVASGLRLLHRIHRLSQPPGQGLGVTFGEFLLRLGNFGRKPPSRTKFHQLFRRSHSRHFSITWMPHARNDAEMGLREEAFKSVRADRVRHQPRHFPAAVEMAQHRLAECGQVGPTAPQGFKAAFELRSDLGTPQDHSQDHRLAELFPRLVGYRGQQ